MNVIDYLLFRLNAKDEYHLHSPFVFKLYNKVLKRETLFPFLNILSDIKYLLFGKRKCSTKSSFRESLSLPERYKDIICNLCREFCAGQVLLLACEKYTIYSTEGFEQVEEGEEIGSVLKNSAKEFKIIVLKKEFFSIEDSFSVIEQLQELISPESILVCENIRFSQKEYDSWKTLTLSPKATLALDVYFLGILFFNKDFSKQVFRLKV